MLKLSIGGKTYIDNRGRRIHALREIKFNIEDRDFVGVVGPSGCGKTSLLNIIAGLSEPTSGGVLFRSRPRIGYVFQEPRLMPWLTVLENVLLVTDRGAEAVNLALELLGSMRLSRTVNNYPGELSGGMQRRVALARAFVIRPQLLLMDEPFVSLDQPLAESLRRLLMKLLAEHPTAVVFVSHNLEETIKLGKRILFFSASPGRIILEETVPAVARSGKTAIGRFQKRLLGEYPNLLLGEL